MLKILVSITLLLVASIAVAQTPEVVVTPADIEIQFTQEAVPVWINGADPLQTIFTVGTITYSGDALSTNITHTTKLNEPEEWELPVFRLPLDPFRKAVVTITVLEAPSRFFQLRFRNRYSGDDRASPWSDPSDTDRTIGKPPGQGVHKK